jgi:hypothetical protein
MTNIARANVQLWLQVSRLQHAIQMLGLPEGPPTDRDIRRCLQLLDVVRSKLSSLKTSAGSGATAPSSARGRRSWRI